MGGPKLKKRFGYWSTVNPGMLGFLNVMVLAITKLDNIKYC
jgi:hypothetical protein